MPEPRTKALEPFRGARVLVLGADGFIGRWVARLLTESGAELALAVLDPARAEPVFARWRVRGAVHAVDLSKPGAARELVRATKPAVLFNLAGYGVARDQREAKSLWRLNEDLLGELALAFGEAHARGWPGTPFVHAGSAAEYGALSNDLDEASECAPTSDYGRTKLRGTRALLLRAEVAGFQAAVGRLFTVYGPGEIAGRLLPTLLAARAHGRPVELTAGTQKRDFVHVEESAEGLLRLALARLEAPSVLNVATGRLTSVRQFALEAAAVLGIPLSRLRFGALPTAEGEMEHEPVTNARLRAALGWTPALSISEGVARTRDFEDRTA
jgi:nucleoside-diphosphate-sugar epimerase